MTLAEVLGPNNLFHDELFGVSAIYPDGWSVDNATRWGTNNAENTVFLVPPEPSKARPSMYYQKFRDGVPPPGTEEDYLRTSAQSKENSRSGNGANDYKNVPGSFAYTEVGGHPSLSYSAVYTQGDKVMTEYFVRILGKETYVMFFVRGTPEDVQALVPQVNQMAATVQVP